MNYFIKSPYHSDIDGCETWWCADSNGYTTILANAGVYTEADKVKMEKIHAPDRCKFVPITSEIIIKAQLQLDQKADCLVDDAKRENKRHARQLEGFTEEAKRISNLCDKLNALEVSE